MSKRVLSVFNNIGGIVAAGFMAFALPAGLVPTQAAAQSNAFVLAVAEASANDAAIAEFYQARDYRPLWTGHGDLPRRQAFFSALLKAPDHGLPEGRYDAEQLVRDFGAVRSVRARGILEVETTRRFMLYAQDIHAGVLVPRQLSKEFGQETPRRDPLELLNEFAQSDPVAFIRALPPTHPDYARLMKEKARLERVVATGGWGEPLRSKKLDAGDKGDAVVALRNRLSAMGYKGLGILPEFNEVLVDAVKSFQDDHGLNSDGVAGPATIEAINVTARERLQQVIVGLERLRWINFDRGKRHIFVNQADFRAYVMDEGKVTLETRVVVGIASSKYRTPEFSHVMTHLIVNPTWHVPQSITRGEYLPMLKENPAALGRQGLVMTDIRGQRVDPTTLDYEQFDASHFPFDLKQPPGNGNALGKVKFMFPNRYNVYLHDTPSKSLFGRDIRAYSHGCVRVQKPFELAYTLLGPQSDNPEGLFHDNLATGRETQIDLVTPIPVHLVYHTAWISADGRANYRLDTYGRDKLIFGALQKVGVVLRPFES